MKLAPLLLPLCALAQIPPGPEVTRQNLENTRKSLADLTAKEVVERAPDGVNWITRRNDGSGLASITLVHVPQQTTDPDPEAVKLRARIAELEIELTIAALEKGLIAVQRVAQYALYAVKAWGSDKGITDEQRSTIHQNANWCVAAEMEITHELERQRARLAALKSK